MALLQTIALKIRRHESPGYSLLYRVAKEVQAFNLPSNPLVTKVARAAYAGHVLVRDTTERLHGVFWAEPLFRARCEEAGAALYVERLPYITGHTRIFLGDNVSVSGQLSIRSGRFCDEPTLRIGDNTFLGHETSITVNELVEIGHHCNIAGGVVIADSDGHPADWERRAAHAPLGAKEISPVSIGNHVWIGRGAQILKGVTIGDRAIVGAGSVVISDVPEDMMAMGSPARLVRLKTE